MKPGLFAARMMGMSAVRRIGAITAKEFRHIVRDWQTLTIVLLMPVGMMFLYGYALTMDVRNVAVMIETADNSPEVNAMIDAIDAADLFEVRGTVRVAVDPGEVFRNRHSKALFRFPPDFGRGLRAGGSGVTVQVLIDGSDPNTGTILRNAIDPLLRGATLGILGAQRPDVLKIDQRVLYNPEQKSSMFFIPGLMAIILLMISAMLTSLTITREMELGSMEQLLVSPLKGGEIIIGKILPYIVLAAIDGLLIMLVGSIAFGVRIAGNPLLLIIASIIYIFTSLSMGLLVSTVTRTQQQAMMVVLPATMLPTIILSGFIFPIASMPWLLRIIAHVIPATYYLEVIRGIILKGVGVTGLWSPLVLLSGIGLVVLFISIRKFRMRQ
jgi:ABC-2 type transport system permease protein